MNALLILLRLILGIGCATALMLTFSYPDSLIAPDPNKQFVQETSIYTFRAYLWLIPLLALELVALAGTRRNLVWFTSLLVPIIIGLLLWPVLNAYRPELLWPTFAFEDGKLSMGLGLMGILLVASVLFRLVLLNYFFAVPVEPYEDNDIGLMELDPSKAQTVREIAAKNHEIKPNFLFGAADHSLIARFYARTRALLQIKRLRNSIILSFVGLGTLWFFAAPSLLNSPQQAKERDWQGMYEFERAADGSMRATQAAVHSAYRVLEQVAAQEALAGMSRKQAESYLRLPPLDEAYREQLRDESDLKMNSAEDIFASRTRFLTISDGTRRVVLYVRFNEAGDRINICEIQEDGWNAIIDYERRRLGADWRKSVLSR